MNDDGHSAETCNYVKCGAQVATKCPFMKDELIKLAAPDCKHEWRQYMALNDAGWPVMVDGFFCVHCRHIDQQKPTTPSKCHHCIIGVRNRGEAWMD